MELEEIRKDFPIFQNNPDLIYFDNAATSQKPKVVIEALREFYENHNANIHRGVHKLAEKASEIYERAREKISRFFNAKKEEIIFTKNATEGINLVANSFASKIIERGDKIVITIMEHHANILPWQRIAKRKGAKLEYMFINKEGKIPEEEMEKINGAKFLAIVHVSNVLGTINPVKEMAKRAKKEGAFVLVDGSQSAPHMKIDVKEIGCDFFAFTGHKMLGPFGTGGIFIKKEIGKEMEPFLLGGDMIEAVKMYDVKFSDPPERFEAGTQNVAGVYALSKAIEYLQNIGMKKIEEYERELTKHLMEEMEKIKDIILYGPPTNERSGIISFNIKGKHHYDVAKYLAERNIAVRNGMHCAEPLHRYLEIKGSVRASLYLYNTHEEIEKFIKEIKALTK